MAKPRKKFKEPRVKPKDLEEGLDVGTPLRVVLPRDIGPGGREYFHPLHNRKVYLFSRYEVIKNKAGEEYYLVFVIDGRGRELKEGTNCCFFRIVGKK